ncbi:HAMP domain-containing protein [Paracoccus liaowanqingii]|uniref:histidine kinase n=2 Tax=Paracoccus liaowanqingii TaxID=2560053 RepID=A0A4Z1CQR9_9RHOB|nr:HAMP domain-containing protein [Paracoccus liaowanqingii]
MTMSLTARSMKAKMAEPDPLADVTLSPRDPVRGGARRLGALLGFLPAALAGWRPTLGARVAVFQAIVVAALGISAAATLFAIERLDYYIDRDRVAGRQLSTIVRLSGHLNRYSENIAELLLLGRTVIDDFTDARAQVDAGLTELQRLIEQEIALIRDPADAAIKRYERIRAAQMRSLFEQIDRTAQRLLLLREDDRTDEAIVLFRNSIEEGLDAELERLVAASLQEEEAELRRIEERTNRLQARLTWFVATVCSATVIIAVLAGFGLTRSLRRPLARFVAATRAIGAGDFAVRLDEDLPGELGDLARQVNRSADRLGTEKQRLLEVQAGLEDEVARRTAELAEANARLQRLDQMRMLFFADISHELRTPLTVLRGEAEVALRSGQSDGVRREALSRVAEIARQMGRLVEDLLFLARAEVGAVRFDIEPLDLRDVVDVMLAEARILGRDRAVEFNIRIPDAPVTVDADAGRLGQALLIVIDNAVKYADPGTVIDLRLVREGPVAVFTLANDGPTIPPADLPFIFSRFHRGRNVLPGEVEGSGLGLSIAKWIVETHKGAIALTSTGGRTLVSIRLPLKD